MSQNKTLKNILEAVYRMAARKRKANQERPEGEKYAELQRVRLGSRLLAYLPMRINDELIEILREFKEKASAIGVKQFIIQTHFQSPLEVTPYTREAIRKSFCRMADYESAGIYRSCIPTGTHHKTETSTQFAGSSLLLYLLRQRIQ